MIIGGFQKFSLSDFPGTVCAIVFTQGCNFRCPYCHNPELVDPRRFGRPIPEETVLRHLRRRIGQIRGVTVTGGEPTIHADLPDFIGRLRSLGFGIKLDTNGSHPAVLRQLIRDRLIDYIALDVKAPLSRYAEVVGAPVNTDHLVESIRTVIASGLPHEMRTTVVESILSAGEIGEIGRLVRGCEVVVLQGFRRTKALEKSMLKQQEPPLAALAEIQGEIEAMGVPCRIR